MRPLALAAILLLGADRLAATAILAFRPDATRIILAADSASTSYTPDGSVRFLVGKTCKIVRAGPWWIMNGALDTAKGLDVTETLRTAVAPTTTLAAALAAIADAYRATIRPIVLGLDYYWGVGYERHKPVVTVLVAGLDGGDLKIGYFGALLSSQAPRTLLAGPLLCPGTLCDDPGAALVGFSLGDPIPRLLETRPRPAWLEKGDAAAARRLIQLQIKQTPERVAPPIDVLELTVGGSRWVDPDPRSACGR